MKEIKKQPSPKSHDGKVVSIAGDKLTSTCGKGIEHHHTVAKDAKITCDGKPSKLSDLKAGASIRVTTCKEDSNKVSAIESGKAMATSSH